MGHPEPRQNWEEFLQEMADHAAELISELGYDRQTSEQIGYGIADHFADIWGGQQIYIPKGERFKLAQRDEEIYREFTGSNHSALAKKFKLSLQWIYRIIRRCRYRDTRQGRLPFDDPSS